MRLICVYMCLAIAFWMVACSDDDTKSPIISEEGVTIIPPSSELASLMKSMKTGMEEMREALKDSTEINTKQLEQWKDIHSAKPTEEGKTGPIYQGMADYFLTIVDSFKVADPTKRKHYYNAMVASCIDCHQELCPGPVTAISKLKLSEK